MIQIVGISGSLRRQSLNTALLRAAAAAMPDGARLEIVPIDAVPLYHGDLEEEHGLPASVVALKEAIAGADALLISTPEYNHGVPGVLKNAIDWASRPNKDIGRVFGGKPVGLIGATPGAHGTITGQTAWLPILRALGTRLWTGGSLMVGGAHDLFDAEGNLTDPAMRKRLARYVEGFVGSIREG